MKINFFVIIGIFLTLGSYAQQQAYQLNYTVQLSEEMLQAIKDDTTLTDPSIQFLQAISSGFDEDNPVLEVWSNKDYFKIKTHMFKTLTQITHRAKQQTFHLFDEDSTYILETLQPTASTWKESIELIKGKTQEIAGYQAKLAEYTTAEEEKVEIWYTEEIPAFFLRDFTHLNDIPGAILRIGSPGIYFEAVKISKQNNLAADFFAVPSNYSQITAAQSTSQLTTDSITESLESDSVEEQLSEGMIAYFDREKSLYGLKTTAGEVISGPKFSTMGDFIDGYAIAYDTAYHAGLINNKGQTVLAFKYTYLEYAPDWGLYVFTKDDGMGLVDTKGQVNQDHQYDYLTSLAEGYAIFGINNKYGLLNENLEITVPADYDYILQYNDQYFVTSQDSSSKIMAIQTKEVVLEGFKELYLANVPNMFIASNDGQHYGYVNAAGETVIPFNFSYASPFVDGKASVILMDAEDFTTINTKGEVILEPAVEIKE